MDSDVSGAPSTPALDTPGSDVIANLSADQRAHWFETGDLPAPSSDSPSADSAPAKPADQAPSTEGTEKAASEPAAKPHKNADTRKAELDAEIQSRLQRRKEIDAEITAAETRLAQLRTAPPSETKPAAPSPAAAPDADPEPDPEKFPDGQFDKGYLKAQARWEARQELRQQMAESAARMRATRTEQARVARLETFRDRLNAAITANPAWWDGLRPEVKDLKPYSNLTAEERRSATALHALADELLDLEHPEVGLTYFSDHPEELARFARLNPKAFLVEWGKVQASWTAEKTAPPAEPVIPAITKVPAPPTTVGRRPAEPADEVDAALQRGDYRTYEAAANRREMGAK